MPRKPKAQSITHAIGDMDVIARQVIWLPAAGLSIGNVPPALEELAALLPGAEKLKILEELPILEQFVHEEYVDADDLCAALEGTEGFIVQMETPKRRWFSDGTERINWGDTYTDWAYASDITALQARLIRFAEDVIESDGRKYARIGHEDENMAEAET